MPGTRAGGQKAAATNKKKYGDDFYAKIGAKSAEGWKENGKKPRGMAYLAIHDPKRLREISSQGGRTRKTS